jgi:hypothetical protein
MRLCSVLVRWRTARLAFLVFQFALGVVGLLLADETGLQQLIA